MRNNIIIIQICFFLLIFSSCNNDDGQICINPKGVQVLDIRSTRVTIDWKPWRNADSYTIEYGIEGFELGTGTRITRDGQMTSSYVVQGLEPTTRYAFYIKSNCSVGEDPNFIGPSRFLTADE